MPVMGTDSRRVKLANDVTYKRHGLHSALPRSK